MMKNISKMDMIRLPNKYRISLNNKRAYYYFYKFLDAQTIQGRALIKGANYFLPGP